MANMRVVIVDDHPLFRQGVVQTLSGAADIEVVAEGSTAADALKLVSESVPDILLLDIDIPGGGIPAAQAVAAANPATHIVMLTVSEEEENLTAALRAGARAYVLKGVSGRELLEILRGVSAGEAYITPALAASLLLEMSTSSHGARIPTHPLNELTEREGEILELVTRGLSNKEIGQQLHLTERTVKHHMTNILEKLQVRNRVEAALLAQRSGVRPQDG